MRKIRLITAAAFVFGGVLLYGGTCGGSTGNAPTVNSVTASASGFSVDLTWSTVDGASEYVVYSGGTEVYRGPNTQATVDSANRSNLIEVASVVSGTEYKASQSLGIAVTSNIDAYSKQDPDPNHPSWLQANFTDGTVSAVNSSSKTSAHQFIDGAIGGGSYTINSNVADNTIWDPFCATGTTWTGSDLAPGSGNWSDPQTLASGGIYYTWFDNTGTSGWGTNDYFGKFEVTAISDAIGMVTLKYGVQYQVSGLRWLLE